MKANTVRVNHNTASSPFVIFRVSWTFFICWVVGGRLLLGGAGAVACAPFVMLKVSSTVPRIHTLIYWALSICWVVHVS